MEKTNVTTTETTNVTPPAAKRRYWWKAIASFLMVLFTMPLGHGLMIIMEHLMSETVLHYSAFVMGAVGMAMVIVGVFAKGDTRQTLWGFFGGLLFWTGWVEFLFMYFANRFGTQPELDPVTGEIVTRPEYLILPASFGFWMVIMVMYLFSTKNGCNFINWWQRLLFRGKKNDIAARPMTRHTSIVTFMELMMLLWTSYLLLMFCYDERFFGDHHPVTLLVGMLGFIGSLFMFAKLLRYASWGMSLRFGFATVIIFWIAVEVFDRIHLLNGLWANPQGHVQEIALILVSFAVTGLYLACDRRKKTADVKRQ